MDGDGTMSKPRVKCDRVSIHEVGRGHVALLTRLSDHPKLGPPRAESKTRTSLIVRFSPHKREIETLNTIYYWEKDSDLIQS